MEEIKINFYGDLDSTKDMVTLYQTGGNMFPYKEWDSKETIGTHSCLMINEDNFISNFRDVGFQVSQSIGGFGNNGDCYDWEQLYKGIQGRKEDFVRGMFLCALSFSCRPKQKDSFEIKEFNEYDNKYMEEFIECFCEKHDIKESKRDFDFVDGEISITEELKIVSTQSEMKLVFQGKEYDFSLAKEVTTFRALYTSFRTLCCYSIGDIKTCVEFKNNYRKNRVYCDIDERLVSIIKMR